MVSMHTLWSRGYAFGWLSLIWLEEPGPAIEGGVLMTRTSLQLKREGSCLLSNNVLCSLFKRLWRHHVWREVKLWSSWRRRRDAMTTAVRGSEIIYKYLCGICRKSVWLPGLLSPEQGGTCVWEKIFLSYRRGVGWAGKWAEEQGHSRTVINELQDRSRSRGNTWGLQLRSLRSTRIDTRWLSHTNLIQITPWACDCFHQIRYSTWCEPVPAPRRLLKDRQ